MGSLVPSERIERSILLIRGQKVLLDRDLAQLFGVETRALVQSVKRNISRFPEDFMFQLTKEEFGALRTHLEAEGKWGGIRKAPYAFTEQGVAMLSGVLRSAQAIEANIAIMRTFVRLRRMIASHADLVRELAALEKKYDKRFQIVFEAIKQLMSPGGDDERREKIGFYSR